MKPLAALLPLLAAASPLSAGTCDVLDAPAVTRGTSLATIYAERAPAIVLVRTAGGHGTGFVVDRDGHVLTNAHVVEGGAEVDANGHRLVHLVHGELDKDGEMRAVENLVQARIVRVDAERDLALLQILDAPQWLAEIDPIPLRTASPRPGEDCIMIGHPAGGLPWTLRKGLVCGSGKMPVDLVDSVVLRTAEGASARPGSDWTRILQSTCGANPGDSGGPLLDANGDLIAVTYAIPVEVREDKFTYHVHLAEVRAFLAEPDPDEIYVPAPFRSRPLFASQSILGRSNQPDVVAGFDHDGVMDTVFFDLDGPGLTLRGVQPGEPFGELSPETFGADMILHIDIGTTTTYLDLDGDGEFERAFVDRDQDGGCDLAMQLGRDGWQATDSHSTPMDMLDEMACCERMHPKRRKLVERALQELSQIER